jgi:tellurium resistance protein TerZ
MAEFTSGEHTIETTPGAAIKVGIKWDFTIGSQAIDLDAQAVAFDGTGVVLDAAFYNQLEACEGSIVHSGDNRDGLGEGIDEAITIHTDRVPTDIQAIAIVVSAHGEGTFENVETASAHVEESSSDGVRELFSLAVGCQGNHTSLLLCLLYRDEKTQQWDLIETPACFLGGHHFQECLSDIRRVVDTVLPDYMVAERVLSMETTFNMKKDAVGVVPPELHRLCMGLGWTTPDDNLDLDASVIMLDGSMDHVDTCYFSQKEKVGVHHMGDNRTGEGEGDDEVIKVNLDEVEPHVHHLVFVVNIFSDHRSFSEVSDSYCRLFMDDTANPRELARFTIDKGLDSRGLVFASISRSEHGWSLKAMGVPCNGKRAVNCIDDAQAIMRGEEVEIQSTD